MDSVQTLDAGRRSMYDPDEIEEEQRERDQRNKVVRYQSYQCFLAHHEQQGIVVCLWTLCFVYDIGASHLLSSQQASHDML